jgi:hypothetical protein
MQYFTKLSIGLCLYQKHLQDEHIVLYKDEFFMHK